MNKFIEEISGVWYYPLLGEILADGALRIPTSGTSETGERWSGKANISSEHPQFTKWLDAIQNKEQYTKQQRLGEFRERMKRERSERGKPE